MPSASLRLAGRDILLPSDHPLGDILRQWPQYGSNMGRIAAAVATVVPDLAIIDVGGNIGDSVVVIRELCDAPVLTVEGFQPYLAYLRPNVSGLARVEVEETFVSGTRLASGSWGVVASGGTAYLSESATHDPAVASGLCPLEDILARRPAFARAKLFKLDTDGMDVSIVLSCLGYVERARPVIFLEYNPHTADDLKVPASLLWAPLRRLGYRFVLVWENTGYYVGCMDLSDPYVAEEVDAAASGWQSKRYVDLCLVHADDVAIAGAIRRAEIDYARTAPRFGTKRVGP